MSTLTSRLTLRLYLGYAFAYLLAIVLLALLAIGLSRLEQVRTLFQSDIKGGPGTVAAIELDGDYQAWRAALNSLIAHPSRDLYEQFTSQDEDWKQTLYDLQSTAGDPRWLQALNNSEQAREKTAKAVSAVAEPQFYLEDAPSRKIMPAVNVVIEAIEKHKNDETSNVLERTTRRLLDSLAPIIEYTAAGKAESDRLSDARKAFLAIEGALAGLNDPPAEVQQALASYYSVLENLIETLRDRQTAVLALKIPDMQETISAVNPLEGSDWQKSLAEFESGSLIHTFEIVRYVLIGGIVLLIMGAVFSFVQVHDGVAKPLSALTSFCQHAYISRKRANVPGSDRKDEFGVLARAIQDMTERAASHSDPEAVDDGVPAGVITAQNDPIMLQQRIAEQAENGATLADDIRQLLTSTDEILAEAMESLPDEFIGEFVNADVGVSAKGLDATVLKEIQQTQRQLLQDQEALMRVAHTASTQKTKTAAKFKDLLEDLDAAVQMFAKDIEALGQQLAALGKPPAASAASVMQGRARRSTDPEAQKALELQRYKLSNQRSKIQQTSFTAGKLSLTLLECCAQLKQQLRTS